MTTPTYTVEMLSPALNFDGVDDRVDVADVHDFAGVVPFTIEFWVKLNALPSGVHALCVGKANATDGWTIFQTDPSTILRLRRRDSASFDEVTTPALGTGVWKHVAFVYDGANMTAYVDAVAGTPVASTRSLLNTTVVLRFGGGASGAVTGFLNGVLDEIRIWNVARTAAQIADNRFRRLAGTESGLVGLWRTDEGTGTQAKDATTNANHGTISGAVWSRREIDVSEDVREMQWSRGKSALKGDVVTGTLDLVMENLDGSYTPTNGNSKFAGFLRPFVEVSVKAVRLGTTFPLFRGFVQRWAPDPDIDRQIVQVHAEDLFKRLRMRTVSTPVLTEQRFDQVIIDILDRIGVTDRDVFSPSRDTTPSAYYDQRDAISALAEVVQTGQYFHFIGEDGKYVVKDRYFGQGQPALHSYTTEMKILRAEQGEEGILNRITVRGEPRQKTATVEVLWKLREVPILSPGQSITFFAEYTDSGFPQAIRAPAVEQVAPVATTDYTANSQAGGGGTDLTASLGVAVTFFAETAKLTLTNNHATLEMHVTLMQLRGKPLRLLGPIYVQKDDTESQESFGMRELIFDQPLLPTRAIAQNLTDYLLQHHTQPRPKVEMLLRNVFPDLLDILLGSVLALTDSDTGITGKWSVRGMDHRVTDQGFTHECVYLLDEFIDEKLFILDDAVMGKLDSGRKLGF